MGAVGLALVAVCNASIACQWSQTHVSNIGKLFFVEKRRIVFCEKYVPLYILYGHSCLYNLSEAYNNKYFLKSLQFPFYYFYTMNRNIQERSIFD